VRVVTRNAGDGVGADDLRALALDVRGRMGDGAPAVVALAGVAKERPAVVVVTNDEARRWGVRANDLVRVAAGAMGGGGGGKDDVAQGGGTDPGKVDHALAQLQHAVGEAVTRGS
jgi:alanyl-tRNA synthetase